MSGVFSLDEGYLMITVQSFLEGQSLYDTVYTQYGPFYYLYEWIVHALLRVPLTHDATRIVTVIHWVIAAALLGFAGGRLLRSRWAGLLVFMQAMAHLGAMANEPGHPQELVAVLLALAMVVVTSPGDNPCGSAPTGADAAGAPEAGASWHMLPVVAAALVLIKINVGVLFGAALALLLAWNGTIRVRSKLVHGMILAGCAVLPFVLMRRHLGAAWCRHYAVVLACAAAAVWLAASRTSKASDRPDGRFEMAVLWFLVPAGVIVAGVMATGTSAAGLLDGLLLTPLKTPSIALLPLKLPSAVMVNAALSLGLSILCVQRPARVRADTLVPLLKGLVGLAGVLAFVGIGELQLGWLLPWAWLIIPSPGKAGEHQHPMFAARVFLSLAAVWQGLQAYPIAGSQVAFATLLFVPVQVVCLWDALAWLRHSPRIQSELASPAGRKSAGMLTAAGPLVLPGLFMFVWLELPAVWRHFQAWEPLRLPGSHLMRFDPAGARDMRALMSYLSMESDTFITYPGYNSFYFWTGKRPPTHLNATGWGLLTHDQQEAILDAVRRHPRAKVVLVTELVKNWPQRVPEQLAPLGAFVLNECRVVREFDIFTILEVKAPD